MAQTAKSFEHSIVEGLISGSSSGHTFGYISTVNLVPVVVRSGTYTQPATGSQAKIVSSSASDASAGTGIRTVRVNYLKSDFSGLFSEDVTLNGTTDVLMSATDVKYVESIIGLTVGSNGKAVGTITLKANAGDNIGQINQNDTRTFWAHHFVALGKNAYLTRVVVGLKGISASVYVRKTSLSLSDATPLPITAFYRVETGNSFVDEYRVPIKVAGPALIELVVEPDSVASATTGAGFDFYEV